MLQGKKFSKILQKKCANLHERYGGGAVLQADPGGRTRLRPPTAGHHLLSLLLCTTFDTHRLLLTGGGFSSVLDQNVSVGQLTGNARLPATTAAAVATGKFIIGRCRRWRTVRSPPLVPLYDGCNRLCIHYAMPLIRT